MGHFGRKRDPGVDDIGASVFEGGMGSVGSIELSVLDKPLDPELDFLDAIGLLAH
jgi:hypothetical protein